MGHEKAYIILGYDKKNDKYIGYTDYYRRNDSCFSDTETKVYWGHDKNSSVINKRLADNKEYELDSSFKEKFPNANPNSLNQKIWFRLRYFCENLNKEYKRIYSDSDVVWKPYRVNSKKCPVKVNMNLCLFFRRNHNIKHDSVFTIIEIYYKTHNAKFYKKEK